MMGWFRGEERKFIHPRLNLFFLWLEQPFSTVDKCNFLFFIFYFILFFILLHSFRNLKQKKKKRKKEKKIFKFQSVCSL